MVMRHIRIFLCILARSMQLRQRYSKRKQIDVRLGTSVRQCWQQEIPRNFNTCYVSAVHCVEASGTDCGEPCCRAVIILAGGSVRSSNCCLAFIVLEAVVNATARSCINTSHTDPLCWRTKLQLSIKQFCHRYWREEERGEWITPTLLPARDTVLVGIRVPKGRDVFIACPRSSAVKLAFARAK
jgi:hypothetical protein